MTRHKTLVAAFTYEHYNVVRSLAHLALLPQHQHTNKFTCLIPTSMHSSGVPCECPALTTRVSDVAALPGAGPWGADNRLHVPAAVRQLCHPPPVAEGAAPPHDRQL